MKTDLAVILYTSGSTGTPKGSFGLDRNSLVGFVVSAGVLIKHENIVAAMTGEQERVFPMIDVDNDVSIAYLPLAHILELSCGLSSAEERKKPVVFLFGRNSRLLFGGEMWLFVSSDVDGSIHSGETRSKGRFASPSSAHHVLCPGQLEMPSTGHWRHSVFCLLQTILDRIPKTVNEKIAQSSFFRRHLFRLSYKIKVKRLEEGLESPHLNKFVRRFSFSRVGGTNEVFLSPTDSFFAG